MKDRLPAHPGSDRAAPLELVTFEDLVRRITEFKDRARADEARVGWAKLLGIASDLAGRDAAQDDLTVGRNWRLTHVRISGYQGIGDRQPLEMTFNPTPGITVVYGPNGSGKSSIADAIETALQGRTRPPAIEGSGGGEPIWERAHRGRDADEGVVDLTLIAGSESLHIHCAIGSSDQTTRYVVNHRTSSYQRQLDLRHSRWMSAIIGHRPVYAYAVVERQVQLAKNLQRFLEELLAFGSCFEALASETDRRSTDATEAKRAWDRALRSAQQRVQTVDDERLAAGRASLHPLTWPTVSEEPDEWLEREGLSEAGEALPEVSGDLLDRLRTAAADVQEQLASLKAAETSLHAQLAGPLKDLHSEASRITQPGTVCPVCGTEEVHWLDRLGECIEDLVEIGSIQRSCRSAISRLNEVAGQGLTSVRTILETGDGDEADLGWWDATVQPFLDTERSAGDRITPRLRSTASGVAMWISSSECERVVRNASAESDYLRQWNRARRAAVADFVSKWRTVAARAREAPGWTSASRRLTDLRNALRRERAGALGTQTNAKVQALLADVGIMLRSIHIQERQAYLDVLDQQEKPLELAMLSAGQRNALLLAPMLAVTGGGPFGFLILDDPVHAFDQIRVDCLAAAIADLARSRRVIVLTHDQRLKEHLLARHPSSEVLAIERDSATGIVTAEAQGEMWEVLLEDAWGVVDAASAQPRGVSRPPYDIVRGLCRQAFDNALRSFVVRVSVHERRSPDVDLAVLDGEDTTRARIGAARGLINEQSQTAVLDNAASNVGAYLTGWNRAAHGNPPIDTPDLASLRAEIQAARHACGLLTSAMP